MAFLFPVEHDLVNFFFLTAHKLVFSFAEWDAHCMALSPIMWKIFLWKKSCLIFEKNWARLLKVQSNFIDCHDFVAIVPFVEQILFDIWEKLRDVTQGR